MGVFGFEFLHK